MILQVFFIFFICYIIYLKYFRTRQNYKLNKIKYDRDKSINYINHEIKNSAKCCILLTMYIKDDRKDLYTDITNKWLNNTNLDIYIVNSSGLTLDINHPRLKQFSFLQNSNFMNKDPSVVERDSILKAFEYFKDDFNDYDIIIKVTGKYFIPELENIIKYIPNDTDIILQNQDITHGQNCELIGIAKHKIRDILSNIESHQPTEHILCMIRKYKSNIYKILKLPPLKIKNNVKRGDGLILKFL